MLAPVPAPVPVPVPVHVICSGVELRLGGVIHEESWSGADDQSETDAESPVRGSVSTYFVVSGSVSRVLRRRFMPQQEENEVDQEVRPKLRSIETTLVEAAGSPMIAAIAATGTEGEDSSDEQLEIVFEEIHKQAMANVLLDITGRIGTRQRDASATAPRRNTRAAKVVTGQVVKDFSKYGRRCHVTVASADGNAVQQVLAKVV